MVQLNHKVESERKVPPPHHLPPRPTSRGSKTPLQENLPNDSERRAHRPPVEQKPIRRHSQREGGMTNQPSHRLPPHHNARKENHRREPLGREEGLTPPKRGSPRHRTMSPTSVASTKASESSSKRRPRGGYPYPEHYGQRGGYDPQSYYYYYQQSLYNQNYYKDYYRRLYGSSGYTYPPGGESMVDDKASTRSGRSSVNDEMKKSSVSSMAPYDPYRGVYDDQHRQYLPSSHFRQDFLHQSSSLGAFEPSAIYPEHESYNQMLLPYASGDVSGVPSITDEGGSDVQQRLSPLLFSGPHLSASFTTGGKLLLVIPSDPKQGEKARVQIRNVQKMLSIDTDLAARIQKMKTYPGPLIVNDTHKDVVISFCNQKIAEALNNRKLLDQDSVVLFWEYLALLVKQNGKVCGADLASLLLKGREVSNSADSDTPHHGRSTDIEDVNSSSCPTDDNNASDANHETKQIECVKKFSELLCLGRKKEAVDYAIKEGLWGYAMTLAAKMDTATHTRVMSAFTQSIPKTHVLQTLLQHLSGKRPDVSKTYSEERWGDWRQHLAMMVSNPTGQLQRDRASIFAFGDTLAAKNRLHAAHLCYLAADAEWGTFSNKESKLVLLGANHHLTFNIFSDDDAIQCTEIFEYAMALDSTNQMMINFQSYKLIYALRLAEAGFPTEALKYCEVITEAIAKNLGAYQINFVSQVLDLATQLKYNDVHYQMGEGEAREMHDPVWLQNLQNALYSLQYQAAQQQELAAASLEQVVKVDQHAYECTTIKQELTYPTYNTETPSLTNISAPLTDNKSLEYNSNDCVNQPETMYPENSHYYNGNNLPEANSEVPMIPTQEDPYEENMQSSMPYDESYGREGENNKIPMMNTNSAPPSMTYYGNTESSPPVWNQQQQQWQNNQEQSQQWQANQQHSWQTENVSQYPRPVDMTDSGLSNKDSHNSVRDAEEEQYWAMMSKKGETSEPMPSPSEPKELKSSEDELSKKEESTKPTSNEDKNEDKKSSGLFGSLFGWRKANNNQAKLPDDKNPSIVWDDQKKKWVNVDGDDTDEASPLPPPSSLLGPPNVASFRGTLKKSRYVDPVGEKSRVKPATSPLLPPLPISSPVQTGQVRQMEPTNFMPQPSDNQPQSSLVPRNEIQMRRNSYVSESSSVDFSEEWDPSLSQGVSSDLMGDPIPMMGPQEAQQPMFFNPSQMQSASVSNQSKRAGPSRRVFNAPR